MEYILKQILYEFAPSTTFPSVLTHNAPACSAADGCGTVFSQWMPPTLSLPPLMPLQNCGISAAVRPGGGLCMMTAFMSGGSSVEAQRATEVVRHATRGPSVCGGGRGTQRHCQLTATLAVIQSILHCIALNHSFHAITLTPLANKPLCTLHAPSHTPCLPPGACLC